jgi:hypothetical protein
MVEETYVSEVNQIPVDHTSHESIQLRLSGCWLGDHGQWSHSHSLW